MQNAVRSGMGLLGMHPSASLSHPLPGQRMPGLLPLDLRPNLLQGAGARFPMIMQQGLAQQANNLLDASLQARTRTPFPQMEHFNRTAEGPFARAPNPAAPAPDNMDKANNNNNNTPTASDSGGQQEGDQDYRFPPLEKPSTGLLRTPPPEMRTEPTPVRAPLLDRPPRGGMHMEGREGPGRREPMPGPFRSETRWGAPRGDLDERDMRGMPAGPPPGPPTGFQEDRGNPNFQNRFDMRGGGAMGGVGPGWNRGSGGGGGGGGPFNANMHQDFDDWRRPWERQKDRDDRDFRREVNENRHRERERERGRDRNRERDRERDNDKERDRERGSWAPLNPQPQPLLPLPRPSQPLLPLPTSLLNLPPSQPESHPKPLMQQEPQPDIKLPLQLQPEKESVSSQEKKDTISDTVHNLNSKPETDPEPTATDGLSHPSPPAPTIKPLNETQAPEVSASTHVAAGGGQTAPKEEAETGTEPELVKTDTEET